jgi:hypothetical protein
MQRTAPPIAFAFSQTGQVVRATDASSFSARLT